MRTAWWKPVVFGALAGGMGWGIRGQYGHETGAMIAGLLVSLTLAVLLCPRGQWPALFRAVAWGTLAMGFGGSMTYGQTLGLTHDPDLVGNHAAWWWGMLALVIKGGAWIGFAGLFLGLGLGGKRYRPGEMLMFMLALAAFFYMGMALLNQPFEPDEKRLPFIYFSDHWMWEPGEDLKPRFECWGGMWAALLFGAAYAALYKRDALARNMACWGVLGGGLGFPLGQCIQSYHAWHPRVFETGLWVQLAPHINWWNMMEITFGAVMGGVLGLGLWLNRGRIQPAALPGEDRLGPGAEFGLLAVHVCLLVSVAFVTFRPVDALYDWGIIMGIIPAVGIAGGRWWPSLQILPLTLIPIAGKTLRQLVYKEEAMAPALGWALYVIVPVAIALAAALWLAPRIARGRFERDPLAPLLLATAWLYFLLNYAFFHFPWPWAEWTGRTPSGIIFTVCIAGLTWVGVSAMGKPLDAGAGPEGE